MSIRVLGIKMKIRVLGNKRWKKILKMKKTLGINGNRGLEERNRMKTKGKQTELIEKKQSIFEKHIKREYFWKE